MIRCVERELLDDLAPDHPDALRERRDLIRINAWMGNVGTMARALGAAKNGTANLAHTLVELGAGDGEFLLKTARRLRGWRDVQATLVDQQDLLKSEAQKQFAKIGWRVKASRSDVFQWLRNGAPAGDVMIANLFLHHFQPAQLRELFAHAAGKTHLFVAVEPRRSRFAALLCHCLPLIGCGRVTRHDAMISVRAGFIGAELSTLWPNKDEWELSESRVNWCSHLFVAKKRT